MTRKPDTRHRGQYRAGLFDNPGQDDGDPEAQDRPILRRCTWPPCKAQVGQPCTIRKNGRRVPIHGYHNTRKDPTQ